MFYFENICLIQQYFNTVNEGLFVYWNWHYVTMPKKTSSTRCSMKCTRSLCLTYILKVDAVFSLLCHSKVCRNFRMFSFSINNIIISFLYYSCF